MIARLLALLLLLIAAPAAAETLVVHAGRLIADPSRAEMLDALSGGRVVAITYEYGNAFAIVAETPEELLAILMDKCDGDEPDDLLRRSLLRNRELRTTFNRAWPLLEATEQDASKEALVVEAEPPAHCATFS